MFSAFALAAVKTASAANPPRFDFLMFTGFLAALVALAMWPYASALRRAAFIFAVSLAVLGYYCFATGAWPAGLVAIVASLATVWSRAGRFRTALGQWWCRRTIGRMPMFAIAQGRLAAGNEESSPTPHAIHGPASRLKSRNGWEAPGTN